MWHGVSFIDPKYPDRSGTHDIVSYGAGLAKAVGFKTIKLEFSIAYWQKYPYQTWSGSPTSLVQLAQEPAFAAVFGDSWWDRFVINTFSLADYTNNPWIGQWYHPQLFETEMYDLASHLLTTYPGKEFIIQNWEGDWQLLNGLGDTVAHQNGVPLNRLAAYRDWHQLRIRAIRRARNDNPSTGKVLYCVELNRVLDGWGRRLLRDVIGQDSRGPIVPDRIGLSAYEAINGWLSSMNQSQLEADIETKLTQIVGLVRKRVPGVDIILTEYGWPIYDPLFVSLGYDIPALWSKAISVAQSLGIVGGIPWELLDNEEQSPGVPRGFLMYDRNGNSTTVGPLSVSGSYFSNIL